MSFYATMQGELEYPDEESFERVESILRSGDWIDSEGFFTDENGNRHTDHPDFRANVDRARRTIYIPFAVYRNLSQVDFFLNKPSNGLPQQVSTVKGHIIGTSTDGCFTGWFIEDGEETSYDLEKWATEHLQGDAAVVPKEEDFASFDEFNENQHAWQNVVQQAFFDDCVEG